MYQYEPYRKNTTVVSSDGRIAGRLTGGKRHCSLDGCGGQCLRVRWPDGKVTWPCTKGMMWDGVYGKWFILTAEGKIPGPPRPWLCTG